MTTINKSNKSLNNSSYGTLYYTFYNPSSSYNKQFNIPKRQRSKDSYAEIAKEKKDLISYEVIQIQKYTEKNNSKTICSKAQSCPKFNNRKIKNKIINKEKENDISNKNNEEDKNMYLKEKNEVNYALEKVEIIPYSTTLRNHSRIINSEKLSNLIKNKEKIINKRKRNFIGSYKISNKIREIFKSKTSNNNFNEINLSNNKKEIEKDDNLGNICLGKISIETYSFKDKNNQNNNFINKNSPENKNINNNKLFILENKENINNNNYENISSSNKTNRTIKRKLNYEEEKNDEISSKTQSENKIYQTLKKMKEYLQSIDSTLIKPYKEKQSKIYNKEKKKNKNCNKNNISTNTNIIKQNSSCPKVLQCNKDTKDIIKNDSLKENIRNILQRHNKFNKKHNNFLYNKEERKNNYYINFNSQFIESCDYNYEEKKLKDLLKKIPNNKNDRNNKYNIGFKYFKEKALSVKEKNKRNKNYNTSSIMPPNNLKEILFNRRINFLLN